ncbi:endonuclease/exonuclease/phosphatase family protein [Lichenifustis flavocetrariae]|uniref:Endonuclease/exonuclease/phosphatase family protein n=1 Tax=Lichenifustis flavocetrariae TaxID=2949735 RepID=A0AA41YYS3_9HYPH|nr:endonuclease/exonuclease/phosphatase family protein [Lichenifustis flavocetrariae]MCW6509776.1 endonuclease/exonuclease/phosphatase family protein [Lichenifustis flavocetrariae]
MKIISWNLLRRVGATQADVVDLVEREKPDLLLMQEVTHQIEGLCDKLGGAFAWRTQPGRIHGLAMWSPVPWVNAPTFGPLRRGALLERIGQIIMVGDLGIANVHLSHGQRLNRRQLREIAALLPHRAAVLGDFNLVGPALLPGFRDVGPRGPTHRMIDVLPLRIDRCLVRGLRCDQARILPRRRSDHHPISVTLSPVEGSDTPRQAVLRYKEAAVEVLHRATGRRRFSAQVPQPAGGPPAERA